MYCYFLHFLSDWPAFDLRNNKNLNPALMFALFALGITVIMVSSSVPLIVTSTLQTLGFQFSFLLDWDRRLLSAVVMF